MKNEKEKFKKDFFRRLITFSVNILRFAAKLRKDRNLWPIADQLIRSSSSVGANVIEAKASSSRKDYLKFFEISLKSANETKYWLIVIKEYSSEISKEADIYLKEADEISKIIGSSVLTLKGKR